MNIIKKTCDNININVVLVVFLKKRRGGADSTPNIQQRKKNPPILQFDLYDKFL